MAWQGSVAHHDSAGNSGVIGPGDVQWMTAASGVLHQEYHEASFASGGGPFHMAQIWVNLPRAHKMAAPRYQALVAEEMGKVPLPDDAGLVRVIAGEYQGTRGPARTYTRVHMLDATIRAGARATFDFPPHENVGVLVMKGAVVLNDTPVATHDLVIFENRGQRITAEATADAQLLVLAGEPIGEPVVQYGPFVMNTQNEIVQAFADFRGGRFGHLDD
jgi:hypothetical protein